MFVEQSIERTIPSMLLRSSICLTKVPISSCFHVLFSLQPFLFFRSLNMICCTTERRDQLIKEVKALEQTDCPAIIRLFGAFSTVLLFHVFIYMCVFF